MARASSCPARSYRRAGRVTDSSRPGPPVQLGGSPGPWPLPAGEPLELGVQQPLFDQFVQVEFRRVPRHGDAFGRPVPADRFGLGGHEQIQLTADRVGQGGQTCHPIGEILGIHQPTLSKGHNP